MGNGLIELDRILKEESDSRHLARTNFFTVLKKLNLKPPLRMTALLRLEEAAESVIRRGEFGYYRTEKDIADAIKLLQKIHSKMLIIWNRR